MLAALLRGHQQEIVVAWAEEVRKLPGSRCAQHPASEIRPWLVAGVEAAIEDFSTGAGDATEAHLEGLVSSWQQMGFDIWEATEALLLFREAVMPILEEAWPGRSGEAKEAIHALNGYLRFLAGRFGDLFAEAQRTELCKSEERFRTIADFTYDWQYWIDCQTTIGRYCWAFLRQVVGASAANGERRV